MRARVILYQRPGCRLCDEMRAVILAERRRMPFDFDEIDIEGDDALLKEYGIRIPVVEVNGEELAEISLDPVEFATALRDVPSELDPSEPAEPQSGS